MLIKKMKKWFLDLWIMPFITSASGPEMILGAGIMMIYAIPAILILSLLYLPAMTIGLTRVYMIVTANEDYEEPLEDRSGPSFIGGV